MRPSRNLARLGCNLAAAHLAADLVARSLSGYTGLRLSRPSADLDARWPVSLAPAEREAGLACRSLGAAARSRPHRRDDEA